MKVPQVLILTCLLVLFSTVKLAHSQTASAALQISPSSIDFGEIDVGSLTAPRIVIVTNSSPSPIKLEQILASGIDFSEKHDCAQTLVPGAHCTIQVFFRPATSGPRTGNLEVLSSDATPHLVGLNGAGK